MLAPRGAPTVALVVGGMAPAPPLSGDLRPPGRGRCLRPEGGRGFSTAHGWCHRMLVDLDVRACASRCVTAARRWFAPGLLRRSRTGAPTPGGQLSGMEPRERPPPLLPEVATAPSPDQCCTSPGRLLRRLLPPRRRCRTVRQVAPRPPDGPGGVSVRLRADGVAAAGTVHDDSGRTKTIYRREKCS